jgi:hypothetical protein
MHEGFVGDTGNDLDGQECSIQTVDFPVLLNTGLSVVIEYLNFVSHSSSLQVYS